MPVIQKIIIILTALIFIAVTAIAITLAVMKNPNGEYDKNAGTRFIAHRGLSGEYYQNTATAFQKAAESPFFYGIETDVYQTSDGVWVCCHDTNPFENENIKVTGIPFSEARLLPLSEKNAETANVTEPQYICMFTTYLDIVMQSGKTAVIEIKGEISDEKIDSLLGVIKERGAENKCVIISFGSKNIRKLRKLKNGMPLHFLSGKGITAFFELAAGYSIGIDYRRATKTLVDTAHRNGCTVNTWTVNDKENARKLIDMGVDFITTNYILF